MKWHFSVYAVFIRIAWVLSYVWIADGFRMAIPVVLKFRIFVFLHEKNQYEEHFTILRKFYLHGPHIGLDRYEGPILDIILVFVAHIGVFRFQ